MKIPSKLIDDGATVKGLRESEKKYYVIIKKLTLYQLFSSIDQNLKSEPQPLPNETESSKYQKTEY